MVDAKGGNKPKFQSTLSMRRATISARTSRPNRGEFQSTLSMRRATAVVSFFRWLRVFQSTLSMRRATVSDGGVDVHALISIHALHEESDMEGKTMKPMGYKFQSTLSMRRATGMVMLTPEQAMSISIHALHEESDSAAGHFCPLFETQASCLALSISNNTADTTNNMSKTSNWLSVSF